MARNENQTEFMEKHSGTPQEAERQPGAVQGNEKQAANSQNTDRLQQTQQKTEHQGRSRYGGFNANPNAGQSPNHGNVQGGLQGMRIQSQARHQNGGQGNSLNQAQNRNTADQGSQMQHSQSQAKIGQQNQRIQPERPEAYSKEGGQGRGYYRERARESDKESLPRRMSQSSAYRHGSRNKAEETIDDIKADIIRLEKEIELEIKEIRSLKL